MNENKLVSIIIPVYNAEKYIEEVLRSVCSQTYSNLQIIVVNDGSTDASDRIISNFLDSRILYIKKENGGVSSARNIGLAHATGDYIRFVDADDDVPMNSIEQMINPFLSNSNIDLVIGNFNYEASYNLFNENYYLNESIDIQTFSKLLCRAPKSFYYGAPWNKLYKKNIIDKHSIRFDEKLRWCEDFVFNLEYYSHCNSIYNLYDKDSIYIYKDNDHSITKRLQTFSDEEMSFINERRLTSFKNYLSIVDFDNDMIYCWNGADLYSKISIITKRKNAPKGLIAKYRLFSQILSDEGMYKFISFMTREFKNTQIWHILKWSIEKKALYIAFTFFTIKGLYVNTISNFLPSSFNKKLRRSIPKSI